MNEFKFKTTKEINVPKLIIDQIIGQDKAVQLLKKIAKQRRNLLLIGSPGVGKSLIAQALAELLSKENIDGALIGGASLDPDQFVHMANAALKKK